MYLSLDFMGLKLCISFPFQYYFILWYFRYLVLNFHQQPPNQYATTFSSQSLIVRTYCQRSPLVSDRDHFLERWFYNFHCFKPFNPLVNRLTNVLNSVIIVWDTLHGVCEDLLQTTRKYTVIIVTQKLQAFFSEEIPHQGDSHRPPPPVSDHYIFTFWV